MTNIREISALETYIVRHPVLRGGKPRESCHFNGDDLPTTIHFGLYEKEVLTGIISLFEAKNPQFSATKQIQIRGMAVLDGYQRRGFGELLVRRAEEHARLRKNDLVWFNARQTAVGFYIKMGYSIIGNAFEIADVGTHFVMYKNL